MLDQGQDTAPLLGIAAGESHADTDFSRRHLTDRLDNGEDQAVSADRHSERIGSVLTAPVGRAVMPLPTPVRVGHWSASTGT